MPYTTNYIPSIALAALLLGAALFGTATAFADPGYLPYTESATQSSMSRPGPTAGEPGGSSRFITCIAVLIWSFITIH